MKYVYIGVLVLLIAAGCIMYAAFGTLSPTEVQKGGWVAYNCSEGKTIFVFYSDDESSINLLLPERTGELTLYPATSTSEKFVTEDGAIEFLHNGNNISIIGGGDSENILFKNCALPN